MTTTRPDDINHNVYGCAIRASYCEGQWAEARTARWNQDVSRRALDLLQRLVQDAVPQAGPGYGERDVNRDDLNAVCAEAEQLLYETRGRP